MWLFVVGPLVTSAMMMLCLWWLLPADVFDRGRDLLLNSLTGGGRRWWKTALLYSGHLIAWYIVSGLALRGLGEVQYVISTITERGPKLRAAALTQAAFAEPLVARGVVIAVFLGLLSIVCILMMIYFLSALSTTAGSTKRLLSLVPELDECAFADWEHSLCLVLKGDGVLKAIEHKLDKDYTDNLQALERIRRSVPGHLSTPLIAKSTAFEAFSALKLHVEAKKETLCKDIQSSLSQNKLTSFDSRTVTIHLQQFKETVGKLIKLGAKLSDQTFLDLLASTLPADHGQSGSYFGGLASTLSSMDDFSNGIDAFKRNCSRWSAV